MDNYPACIFFGSESDQPGSGEYTSSGRSFFYRTGEFVVQPVTWFTPGQEGNRTDDGDLLKASDFPIIGPSVTHGREDQRA